MKSMVTFLKKSLLGHPTPRRVSAAQERRASLMIRNAVNLTRWQHKCRDGSLQPDLRDPVQALDGEILSHRVASLLTPSNVIDLAARRVTS